MRVHKEDKQCNGSKKLFFGERNGDHAEASLGKAAGRVRRQGEPKGDEAEALVAAGMGWSVKAMARSEAFLDTKFSDHQPSNLRAVLWYSDHRSAKLTATKQRSSQSGFSCSSFSY